MVMNKIPWRMTFLRLQGAVTVGGSSLMVIEKLLMQSDIFKKLV